MNQLHTNEIFVGQSNKPTNLSEIVRFAQEKFGDQHFCALQGKAKDFHLTFEPCVYQGPLRDSEIPNRVLSLHGSIFEHFLQSVRLKLLLKHNSVFVSFGDVSVIASHDGVNDIRIADPVQYHIMKTLRQVY